MQREITASSLSIDKNGDPRPQPSHKHLLESSGPVRLAEGRGGGGGGGLELRCGLDFGIWKGVTNEGRLLR